MLVVLSPISICSYICVGNGLAKCLKISKSIWCKKFGHWTMPQKRRHIFENRRQQSICKTAAEKKYLDQLLGARSTQKLVEIHNIWPSPVSKNNSLISDSFGVRVLVAGNCLNRHFMYCLPQSKRKTNQKREKGKGNKRKHFATT